jgi:hypothetical protein
MNTVAKAIITKWAETSALTDLIPVAKVIYGIYIEGEPIYPFVTLTEPGGSVDFTTNNRTCYQESITIRVAAYYNNESDDYDSLSNLMQAIRSAFYGFDVELENDEGGIANTIPGTAQYIQDDEDGTWVGVIDLNLMVTRNG